MIENTFVINKIGIVTFIYDDALVDLLSDGESTITRASTVEPVGKLWCADLAPVGGPKLPVCTLRADALRNEVDWLNSNLHRLT